MRTICALSFVPLLLLSSCATPKGSTVAEQRSYVQKMRDDTLNRFYSANPSLSERVGRAAGYGVFSDLAVRIFVLGGGHGYGVVRDNDSALDTYMRMGQLELGVGIGVRDFRALFVFRDEATLRTFVESGWQFGGNLEASAIVSGDKGASVGAQGTMAGGGAAAGTSGGAGAGSRTGSTAGSLGTGIEVYQLTESGLVLSAGIAGTKYWRDGDLN
jgi:lipid-binding SYLF domain-containing protein